MGGRDGREGLGEGGMDYRYIQVDPIPERHPDTAEVVVVTCSDEGVGKGQEEDSKRTAGGSQYEERDSSRKRMTVRVGGEPRYYQDAARVLLEHCQATATRKKPCN